MKVKYWPTFEKDVRAIAERGVRRQLEQALETLYAAKDLRDVPNVRKLQGGEDMYRIRVGEYRIGLQLSGDTVVLIRFLPRKDVYRHFP